LNLYRASRRVTLTSANEATDIKAGIFGLQSLGEIHRNRVPNVRIVDVFDYICDHFKVFAGHALLLCWVHINNKHDSGLGKLVSDFFRVFAFFSEPEAGTGTM
jgi:hypothetical protein